VAVCAILADVAEDRLDVTLGAGNFLVHAAQWILRFVVVKFGDDSDGTPARGGVAVFARNVQRPVRIAGGLILGRGNRLSCGRGGVSGRIAGGRNG
jgi:hypothetical protein